MVHYTAADFRRAVEEEGFPGRGSGGLGGVLSHRPGHMGPARCSGQARGTRGSYPPTANRTSFPLNSSGSRMTIVATPESSDVSILKSRPSWKMFGSMRTFAIRSRPKAAGARVIVLV